MKQLNKLYWKIR